MAKKGSSKKGAASSSGKAEKSGQDSRFSGAGHDPRFQRLPRSKRAVKVDDRFKKMFTDEKFTTNGTLHFYPRG